MFWPLNGIGCSPLLFKNLQIAVLNAANEKAVELFLEERFKFIDIPKVIEAICEKHKCDLNISPSLSEILEVDSWARKEVFDYSERNITKIAASD